MKVGGSSVYDPFMGAGTVLTEAIMLGEYAGGVAMVCMWMMDAFRALS